jgi:hypothetical protein
MKYFVTSSKDASVYTDFKNQNTGKDQILDLFKFKTADVDRSSRAFIQFDLTNVSESIASGEITSASFDLELKATKINQLVHEFDLEIMPISQSWSGGLGRRQDFPKTTDGVSYNYRDFISGSAWATPGGDFITSLSRSVSFNQHTHDLNVDVTDIVNAHIEGTLPNYGMVIKFTDEEENDLKNYGEINFFSSETNTIFRPKLAVKFDDQVINTGSLTQTSDENAFITIKNLKKEYIEGHTYKFRLHTRDQFPLPTFTTGSVYQIINYLPTGSKYSIVDNVTGDTIVPFDDESKLSVDSQGNYFNQNFTGWEPERFYKIKFKIDNGDGSSQLIDKNYVFKLIENNVR